MYMKATHVWTSMYFWELKGTQEGGTGRCRWRCPFGEIGGKERWVHKYSIGRWASGRSRPGPTAKQPVPFS